MDKTQNQKIFLRQYVLPYQNYTRDAHGWQFGMPDGKVQVVQKNGRKFQCSSFDTTRPDETKSGQPPRPQWYWVPVQIDGQTKFACVTSPVESKGSVPLSWLEEMDRCRIKTADGTGGVLAPDVPFSIYAPNHSETVELNAGQLILADVKIGGNRVQWIKPVEAAYKLGLWTSHLSRLAELKFTFGLQVM